MQCILLLRRHFDLLYRVLEDFVEAGCLVLLVPIHGNDDDEMVLVQLCARIETHAVRAAFLLRGELLVGQAGCDILGIRDFKGGGAPDVVYPFANGGCELDGCGYVQGTTHMLVHVFLRGVPEDVRPYY
jgi:hypothetical protein